MPSYNNHSIRTKAEAEMGLTSIDQLTQQAEHTFCYTVGQDDGTLTTLSEFKQEVRTIAGTPKGRRAVLMVDEVHSNGTLVELHVSVDKNPAHSPNGRNNVNRA